MSNINPNNIDENYPVQGQDNPTQGFRDNFNAIKTAFTVAKSEITNLETTSAKLNASNDFNGNVIEDALLNNTRMTFRNKSSAVGTLVFNVQEALVQKATYTGDGVARLSNWPVNNSTAKCQLVRLHLKFDLSVNDPNRLLRRISFATDQGGIIKSYTTGAPIYYTNNTWSLGPYTNPSINTNINDYEHVIEAWSYDGGNTVFLRYLGSCI